MTDSSHINGPYKLLTAWIVTDMHQIIWMPIYFFRFACALLGQQ